jgi:hypothetical protein
MDISACYVLSGPNLIRGGSYRANEVNVLV